MPNRRDFLRHAAGAGAGMLLFGPRISPQDQRPAKHAPVLINGRRVKAVDVHAHIYVPEVAEMFQGTPLEHPAAGGGAIDRDKYLSSERIRKMDEMGVDVQALSVNTFWYSLDRDKATRLIDLQNRRVAEMIQAANPERFVGFASVALQFPELAAQQLEEGMKRFGFRGAAIGPTCGAEELSSPKFDPFWAKAEELQALIFVHPQDSAKATGITARVGGNGDLDNVIGNPLETTIFLSHMIFEGTLDRFPNLKICAAHAGGYLPSYPGRMDWGCYVTPERCQKPIKKKPSEYLKQIYFDSLVFTPEGLRHLAAEVGASQIGLGTDYPFPWSEAPVDLVMQTPELSDADREAILGGTMCKLLKIPS